MCVPRTIGSSGCSTFRRVGRTVARSVKEERQKKNPVSRDEKRRNIEDGKKGGETKSQWYRRVPRSVFQRSFPRFFPVEERA